MHNRGRILWHLDIAEESLDFSLYMVYIHITNYNDTLIVGAIPFFIIIPQNLVFEVVDNAHQTDRHSQSILTIGIEHRQIALKHSCRSAGTHTPLLMYYSTLLVNLCGIKSESICPVMEDKQTRVKG